MLAASGLAHARGLGRDEPEVAGTGVGGSGADPDAVDHVRAAGARHPETVTVDGIEVPVVADTVCLHGDGAHAVSFARILRSALQAAQIHVSSFAPP